MNFGEAGRTVQFFASRLVSWLSNVNFHLSSFIVNVTLIAMITLSALLFGLAFAQIKLQQGKAPPELTEPTVKWVLEYSFGADKVSALTSKDRADAIGSVVSATGAVVTAVFALVAWFVSWVNSNAQKRNATILRTRVVDPEGIQDVRIMYAEYKHAKRVYVFGGDFSWMRAVAPTQASEDFRRMRELVSSLADDGRIVLVSYKSAATVEKTIGTDLFVKVKGLVKYQPKLADLRASFVITNFGRVLLYKVHTDSRTMHICHVTERTPDGRALLDQFEKLIGTI